MNNNKINLNKFYIKFLINLNQLKKQIMMKDGLQLDKQHEFKGVTVRVLSASNLRAYQPLDDVYIFVRIKIKQKIAETTRKHFNDRQIKWDEDFFYNTAQIIDDDVDFEVYYTKDGQGISKNLMNSSKMDQSKLSPDADGSLLGSKKNYQISRQPVDNQKVVTFDLTDQQSKVTGKLTISYEFLQRQDIVGGIRCPNLSLRPSQSVGMRSKLVLENKHTSFHNLYSFWDGQQVQNCEFFPKKFQH